MRPVDFPNDYICPLTDGFKFCNAGWHLSIGRHSCKVCATGAGRRREKLVRDVRNDLAELRRAAGVPPLF